MARMVLGLERYQLERNLHFVTFSCFHRLGYLRPAGSRDLFEDALARMSYSLSLRSERLCRMPEHVHLLLSEPDKDLLSVGMQALNISVSKKAKEHPFWQARSYDV
jgi:putative transposase